MRVLVLGGTGMLGHKVYQVLGQHFETKVTVRERFDLIRTAGPFSEQDVIEGVDVADVGAVETALTLFRPEAVVNCAGIIKQLPQAHDAELSISVNSLAPHRLASLCQRYNARFIQISTDCVFSGQQGMYTEADNPDPVDLYGRSKLLGEVDYSDNALTLRTSIIGRELASTHSLVEWFLSQSGPSVKGYTKAIFSGLPTLTLADVIMRVLRDHPDLHGLYHVSSQPISKYDLLTLMRDAYGKQIEIVADKATRIDRSLDSQRFTQATGITISSWPKLIEAMTSDPTPYEEWRAGRI